MHGSQIRAHKKEMEKKLANGRGKNIRFMKDYCDICKRSLSINELTYLYYFDSTQICVRCKPKEE